MNLKIESLEFFWFDSVVEMLHPCKKNPNPEMATWTKHLIKTASIKEKLKSFIKTPLKPYTKPEKKAKKWPA